MITAFGFDNLRHNLYFAITNGSTNNITIYSITVEPYDRVNSPSVQKILVTSYPVTNGGSLVTGNVYDIAVERESGVIFITTDANTASILYKINPNTGETYLSRTYPGSPTTPLFSNNNLFYLYNPGSTKNLKQVDPNTLVEISSSTAGINVGDFAVPLYGM